MIRDSLSGMSKHFFLSHWHNNAIVCFRSSDGAGADCNHHHKPFESNISLKISKVGNVFQAYISTDGNPHWTKYGSQRTINFSSDSFYVGIAVSTASLSIAGDLMTGEDCEALSYDVCRNFVSELDRLYEASGEINPMRKDPSISLHDKDTQNVFQHAQFPTAYQFPQDARGIVDKSFNYDSTSHVGGAFHLINQSSGKALVLTAGTQVSAICLQSMSF